MSQYGHVIEFYGENCPHCMTMRPLVEEIESETGGKIQKLEVWNDEANSNKMLEYDDIISSACGGLAGVPSFVNTETKQALCGEHEKADIIALMEGGDCTDNVCKPHSKLKK
jgi:thiol-disulfide isomerase/thioredoxin